MDFASISKAIWIGATTLLCGFVARIWLHDSIRSFNMSSSAFGIRSQFKPIISIYACICSLTFLHGILPTIGKPFDPTEIGMQILFVVIVGCTIRLLAAAFGESISAMLGLWLMLSISLLWFFVWVAPSRITDRVLNVKKVAEPGPIIISFCIYVIILSGVSELLASFQNASTFSRALDVLRSAIPNMIDSLHKKWGNHPPKGNP